MEAVAIVNKMFEADAFSRWLGIKIIRVVAGEADLTMEIKPDMLNGFGIAHGGITYSFADSALAFASNAQGKKSLSIDTGIAHVLSLKSGDQILACAKCLSDGNKLGHYEVKISLLNQPDKIVALFKGTIYKTKEDWT